MFKRILDHIFGWRIVEAHIHSVTNTMVFTATRWLWSKKLVLMTGCGDNVATLGDANESALTFFSINKEWLPNFTVPEDWVDLYFYTNEINNANKYIVDANTGENVRISNGPESIKEYTVQAYIKYMLNVFTNNRNSIRFNTIDDINHKYFVSKTLPQPYIDSNVKDEIISRLKTRMSDIKNVQEFIKVYKFFMFNPTCEHGIFRYAIGFDASGGEIKIRMNRFNSVLTGTDEVVGNILNQDALRAYGLEMEYFMFLYLFMNKKTFPGLQKWTHVSKGLALFKKGTK